MNEHSEDQPDWEAQRNRIIGLGETSIRKSYFPELQLRIRDLERKNEELQAAYEQQAATGEELRQQIEENQKKEQELRRSEERYRTLVDITETGYLVLDNNGLVIDANDVYVQLTGRRTLDDLTRRSVIEWTAPHDRVRNAREVDACFRTGFVRGLEIDYLWPDGTVQPIEINATVFHSESGDILLTLCHDISARRRINVALQQARSKLALLNTVTFQDIRTSAFSLAAYQELAKSAGTEARASLYLEKQASSLKKIINTLEFAKNYQEMGIHPARWQNIRQVFIYAISHLDFLNIRQDIQLDNLEIFADPLLEKALVSIMQNVLVHGGNVSTVRLTYARDNDGLTLIIEDDGVGIPDEQKKMIFDRGYGKNTGLGLFLTREVLSITGITIHETGKPGTGARFELFVPEGTYRFV